MVPEPKNPFRFSIFLSYILFLVSWNLDAGGLSPKKGQGGAISSILSVLKSKGYILEPKSQFHIKLKTGESVRYIIASPFYLTNTMVGVAGDENVKKFRILLYSLSDREDPKGRLVEGEEVVSNLFIKEIKERSYYYMIEITLLETSFNEYSSIDLMYGFKSMQLVKEDPKIKENYYDHSDEKYLYNSLQKGKIGKEKPTPSDSGKVPCTTFDANRSCMGN
jgi:hypothetical protein